MCLIDLEFQFIGQKLEKFTKYNVHGRIVLPQ